MNNVVMYRMRISKRLASGRYEHKYSKEYTSVQELFAQPGFAQYVQDNVAGNIYMSLHIEKRIVVVEEQAK